jgi:predicted DNA-binding ribbon-helix-helix protein
MPVTQKQIAIIAGATAAIFSIVGGFLGYTIGRTPPAPIVIQLQKHQWIRSGAAGREYGMLVRSGCGGGDEDMDGVIQRKKSLVEKRSVLIGRRHTSVSLEAPFWHGLNEIAAGRQISLSALITQIDATRDRANLSSAIRLFVLAHFVNWASSHG